MCFFHHSQPVKCKSFPLRVLFFVCAFFSSSPLSPFLSFCCYNSQRILVVGSSARWRSLEATSFYNNLCVEPSSNPKNFGAFHLVSATRVGSGLPKATRYIWQGQVFKLQIATTTLKNKHTFRLWGTTCLAKIKDTIKRANSTSQRGQVEKWNPSWQDFRTPRFCTVNNDVLTYLPDRLPHKTCSTSHICTGDIT